MNKAEFVEAVAAKADMSKTEAASAVDAVLDSVADALKSGEQVTLVGFGTFLVRKREARTGRNPRTGEPLEIKASNVPSFKAGKALKETVNESAWVLSSAGRASPLQGEGRGFDPLSTHHKFWSGSSVG